MAHEPGPRFVQCQRKATTAPVTPTATAAATAPHPQAGSPKRRPGVARWYEAMVSSPTWTSAVLLGAFVKSLTRTTFPTSATKYLTTWVVSAGSRAAADPVKFSLRGVARNRPAEAFTVSSRPTEKLT